MSVPTSIPSTRASMPAERCQVIGAGDWGNPGGTALASVKFICQCWDLSVFFYACLVLEKRQIFIHIIFLCWKSARFLSI